MTQPTASAPPGSWESPIDAEQAMAQGRTLEAVRFAGEELWWSEGRPAQGGRVVICHETPDGAADLLPAGWNARTRVHEYGGPSWLPIANGAAPFDLIFAEFSDQRLYLVRSGAVSAADTADSSVGSAEPTPLTPEPDEPWALRYADLYLDARRGRVLAVRETHHGDGTVGTVSRTLVAIPLDGSGATDPAAVVDLLAGGPRSDFLASPVLSSAGDALLWCSWNHPDMPWDATIVNLAPVDRTGGVGNARQISGGPGISVVHPGFTSDGSVLVISDESGWWQPTVIDPATGHRRVLSAVNEEFAEPLWELGVRAWAALPGGRLLVTPDGRPSVLDTFDATLTPLDPDWTWCGDLATSPSGRMGLVVGGDMVGTSIVRIDPDGRRQVLRRDTETGVPEQFRPRPVPRTVDGVHVVIYPPTHPEHAAAPGTAPLITYVHGGPTSAHARTLSAKTAYYTSRGFAVAAVDYRGSSGYGREYRDALRGNWARADVEDVISVARALLADGTAGAAVIVGGSAGGLTVLGTLTTPGHPFAGGVSYFGVADLVSMNRSTHDFEGRYLDGLLGPDQQVWRERSPLINASRLATPVLLLQGGRDPIVTPDQAELFAKACSDKGISHALVIYPDESHGFRSAAARIDALQAELSFYGQVLGIATPGVPKLQLRTGAAAPLPAAHSEDQPDDESGEAE